MAMTWDDIVAFAEERDTIYRAVRETGISDRERVLARMVKLMEEVGELSDEVLGGLGHQRQIKLDNRKNDGLEEEVADVVITVLLLARSLGVNVP
ncbi:MAG: MazG-like family protein, partial [Patescibacteria group bacterium]|nr:MazG-like family protein [Patescibacteria group bacterium]